MASTSTSDLLNRPKTACHLGRGWKTLDHRAAVRINLEARILARTLVSIHDAGHRFVINDGESTVYIGDDVAKALAACMTTDEEVVTVLGPKGTPVGKVFFVYGNSGWDVISDYSIALESLMAPVEAYALSQET